MRARLPAFGLAVAVLVLVAACGGGDRGGGPDPESAWLSLLAGRGLEPARNALEIHVEGDAPTLLVTITAPADRVADAVFADGLFGAEAYSFRDGAWIRTDTADIRTEIAPILRPGESATVELPVDEAAAYRVLVPLERAAAWADSA